MDTLENAVQEMNIAFLRARTPCGIAEGCSELNDANRAVILAMKEQYGDVYLVSVNGSMGIRKFNPMTPLTNFCCDYCVPVYDEEAAHLIERWNENYSADVLNKLYHRLETLGARMLIWS